MKTPKNLELTSFDLHWMAMAFMLCDHLWGTIVPGNDWMTCIGRIAFPIYAFLLVEGYFHTKNLRSYKRRLLVFALISEIPFNLAMGSRMIFPIHQNVLWSFLISLTLIQWNEKARKTGILWKRVLIGVGSVALGYLIGILTFVDFYHAGILTVLAFYFFRGRKWWNYAGQLICTWYINAEILGGYEYVIELFGHSIHLMRQSFALLALIPIWLYRGRQGRSSKGFQYFCYWFYPVHLLILGLLKLI